MNAVRIETPHITITVHHHHLRSCLCVRADASFVCESIDLVSSSDDEGEGALPGPGLQTGLTKVPWAPGPIVGVRSVDMVDLAQRMAWVTACDTGKGAKFEAVNLRDWNPNRTEAAAFDDLRRTRNSIVERDRFGR